jgi:hypothetical protein
LYLRPDELRPLPKIVSAVHKSSSSRKVGDGDWERPQIDAKVSQLKLPVKMIVFNNGALGFIESDRRLGATRFWVSVAGARSCGMAVV